MVTTDSSANETINLTLKLYLIYRSFLPIFSEDISFDLLKSGLLI